MILFCVYAACYGIVLRTELVFLLVVLLQTVKLWICLNVLSPGSLQSLPRARSLRAPQTASCVVKANIAAYVPKSRIASSSPSGQYSSGPDSVKSVSAAMGQTQVTQQAMAI